jgi:hypothetical protein
LLGDGLEGTNGNINARAATGKKADLGAGIGIMKGKWNLQLNVTGAQYNTENTNKIYTENYYETDTVYTSQYIINTPEINRLNSNLSAKYKLNEFNDLELTAAFGGRKIQVDSDIESISNEESGNYAYINRRRDNGKNHRIGLNYSGLLSKDSEEEKKLEIKTNYFYSKTGNFKNIQLVYNDFTDTEFLRADLQVDYENELNENNRFETGIRSYIRNNGMNYNRDSIDSDGNSTPIIEDDFLFKENIQAGYFQWYGNKNKLDYSLGLRCEYTFLNAEQRLINETFKQNHIYFFPSMQLMYQAYENHKFNFNYNRTIRRQRINEINPFINDANPKNIHFGNPELKPSVTGNYILKYEGQARVNQKDDSDNRMHNWSLSLIFRERNDHIFRAALPSEESEGVIENSFYNLKRRYDFNIEALFSSYLFPWWKIDLVPSFRHLFQDGTNIDPEIKETSDFIQIRMNSNMNLWQDARLVANYFYRSAYNSPQGNVESFGRTNFTLHQNLFDNKLSIKLAVKDPFGQSKIYSHIRQEDFIQDREFEFERNIYELSIRYNFGKLRVLVPADENRNILDELQ